MPENHNLEISIQQKMDLFRVEPDPADWQRIYEQLHPKKRKRFFFWIFPLAGALIIGGYLATNNQQANSLPVLQSATETTKSIASTSGSIDPAKSSQPVTDTANQLETIFGIDQPQSLTTSETTTPITETRSSNPPTKKSPHQHAEKNVTGISTQINNSIDKPLTQNEALLQKTPPQPRADATTKSKAPAQMPAALPTVSNATHQTAPPPTNAIKQTNETALTSAAPQKMTNATQHLNDSVQTSKADGSTPNAELITTDSATGSPKASAPTATKDLKKNIPNKASHKDAGWYLGGYAEIATNKPTEPISMAKSADLGNVQQGGTIYQASSSRSNGIHYALGPVIERKKKKFSMNFGLGIQQNTWSSNYVIYKDSIQSNGALVSRTQLSTKQTNYRHTALEIPINFNFRLAGKGPSSFWLGAGLNNAITLGLRETSNSTSNMGLDNTLSDSIRTADATRYQPQLRLSLMYEHAGKNNHWQVSPFMQYGLNSMVNKGEPDILMLHFGLQFRYYLIQLGGKK